MDFFLITFSKNCTQELNIHKCSPDPMDAPEEHDGFLALMPAGSGVFFTCARDLVTEVIVGLKSVSPFS
jgi:hypothetical protein